MAASQINVKPPVFDEKNMTWQEYKKEIEVWAMLTTLPEKKRGPALWISLTGKAKDAVKDMEIVDLAADDGLSKMMEKLDLVFKTDENHAAYMAYRNFELFLRDEQMSFQDFVIRFESMHSKIKKFKMNLPDGVLAYRFLHSANLSEENMQLCRATIKEFTYAEMKTKVLSLFGDKVQSGMASLSIKEEPVFYGQSSQNDKNWNSTKRYDGNRRGWKNKRGGRGGDNSGRGGRVHVTPQKPQNRRGADGKVTQ